MSETPRILTHVPQGLLARVRAEFPELSITQVPEEGPLPDGVSGEILLTQAWGSSNMEQVLARGVRWVHTYGTGVNRFPFETLGDRPLTCARGASAVPIAEWVLAAMLAAEKQFPETWIHDPSRWEITFLGGLSGKTLGLIGLGGIALAVAKRALAFDMAVRAFRRTSAPSPLAGVEVTKSLDDLLASADHLVIAAPATAQTRHMMNADAFARVKPGVHLVNVARGELVDQDALRAALDSDRVALASLDCAEPEPLPAGHWLYSHPKVRLSPHISWSSPQALDWLLDPFLENLRRYQAGEPLLHGVDLEQGY